MNVTILLALFCVLELLTPLCVQGIKSTLEGLKIRYNATLIALIVAIVLSIASSMFYMLSEGITIDALNVFYILALIMANWLGSTLGYDKVKAVLQGIKETKE